MPLHRERLAMMVRGGRDDAQPAPTKKSRRGRAVQRREKKETRSSC
jgi:hypothetical protein